MRVEYYKTPEEKLSKLKTANKAGETQIHDDYIDSKRNITDGNNGRLTFDVKPNPNNTEFNRVKELKQKAKNRTLTQSDKDEVIERLARNL